MPNKLMLDPDKNLALVSIVRDELRRRVLNLKELVIAENILDMSYGWGLHSVRLSRLEDFSDLTGFDKGYVHHAVEALEAMKIIKRKYQGDYTIYHIQPDFEHWQVRVRVSQSTVNRARETLRAMNGLEQAPALPASPLDIIPNSSAATVPFPKERAS